MTKNNSNWIGILEDFENGYKKALIANKFSELENTGYTDIPSFSNLSTLEKLAVEDKVNQMVKKQTEERITNFIQRGDTIACGHCKPHAGFALVEDYGLECDCKCHLRILEAGITQALAERERILGIIDEINLCGQLDYLVERIKNV